MKSARLGCNLINSINVSKERTYHSELQSASRGRTENGKSERQTLASALLELPRGEGDLAKGLGIFLSHWQDHLHGGMSISGCQYSVTT